MSLLPSPESSQGERLADELQRFSFGAAVSPLAEVDDSGGKNDPVKTMVALGGISLTHAQVPETIQQNLLLQGENVPPEIAGRYFLFDTQALLLMQWAQGHAGPVPVPDGITAKVAETVATLNNIFEQGGNK